MPILKRKPLMSRDTQRPVRAPEPRAPLRGPQSSELGGMNPLTYIAKFGLPAEIDAFAAAVADRIASEPAAVWQRCPACGRVNTRQYRAAAGGRCLCNYAGYTDSKGWMVDMADAEVEAYLARRAANHAQNAARLERARRFAENQERQRAGLLPLRANEPVPEPAFRAVAPKPHRFTRMPSPDVELRPGPRGEPTLAVRKKP